MNTVYEVEGMTCTHCERSVQKIFSGLGFEGKADFKKGQIELNKEVSEDVFPKLQEILKEDGYVLKGKL